MASLSIDFETRATVDLKKTGVYPYAMHQDTDIWCMAWAFDDEEPEIWTPEGLAGIMLPQRIIDHILAGGEIRAWNAQFERIIWHYIMVPRYGAVAVKLSQWVDTAAEAAAMALPRGLDQCARVLKVADQKDEEGYRLMLRMTKPRKVWPDGRIEWWDVPERKQRLFEYCKQDVRTERALGKAIRRLIPREQALYALDQTINDRGVKVDRELVLAAQDIVNDATLRANQQLAKLTGGDVTEITNHGRLREWLQQEGVETDSIAKAAVAALLERDDLAEKTREVLELRADAGRSSVAKLQAMLNWACTDDRMRGLALYHAASTGRWGGKGVQPHNFPRGEVKDIERYIPLVLDRDMDTLALFGPPVVIVLSMLRSMLVADEGHDLMVADFSAIEARVLNWLAGQEDVLDLFRKMDAAPEHEKKLYDPYRHNAARLYDIPLDQVQKFPHRQTGKFQELGCGYQMGAERAVVAAKDVYGLDLSPEAALKAVTAYRATHPMVKSFWYDSERALRMAVQTPGEVQYFGAKRRLRAVVAGHYLYLVLPSGRPLCYAGPKVVTCDQPWCDVCGKRDNKHVDDEGKPLDHDYEPAQRDQVQIWGVNPMTKQWAPQRLYGGVIVENIVQAASRDLLAEAMFRAEAAGYPVVMHVHDELVTEPVQGHGSVAEFERLMAALPEWAEGCPVAAEGWRGARYRK